MKQLKMTTFRIQLSILIVLLVALIVAVTSNFLKIREEEAIKKIHPYAKLLAKNEITIAVQTPAPPFFTIGPEGPQGFNAEFIKLLFKSSVFGYPNTKIINYKYVDTFNELYSILKDESVLFSLDGIVDENNNSDIILSVPYLTNFGYGVAVKKNSQIKSIDDLIGKKIGVMRGDATLENLLKEKYPKFKTVQLSEETDSSGKWIAGFFKSNEIDAIIYDYPFLLSEVANTDLKIIIKHLPGYNMEYKLALNSNNAFNLDVLNMAILETLSTKEYSYLVEKYFGSTEINF